MTNEQINAAIAGACGWENVYQHPKNPNVWVGKHAGRLQEVPDYCGDLNAMAEAEKTLTNVSDAAGYSFLLEDMENMIERWVPYRTLWALSARQRAEAFLRTLGKWEEGK